MPFIQLTRLEERDTKKLQPQRVSIRSEFVIAIKENKEEGWTAIQCADTAQNFVVSETFEEVSRKLEDVESTCNNYVVYADDQWNNRGDIN